MVCVCVGGDYKTWASSLPASVSHCAEWIIIQLQLFGRWVKMGRIQTLLVAEIFVAQHRQGQLGMRILCDPESAKFKNDEASGHPSMPLEHLAGCHSCV